MPRAAPFEGRNPHQAEERPQAALQQAQELFDDVAKEIEERELFLAEIAHDPARAVELKCGSRARSAASRNAKARCAYVRRRTRRGEQHQHQRLSRRQDGGLHSR